MRRPNFLSPILKRRINGRLFLRYFFASVSDAEAFAKDCRDIGLEADVFPNESGKTGVTVEGLRPDMEAFRALVLANDWPWSEVRHYVEHWLPIGDGLAVTSA